MRRDTPRWSIARSCSSWRCRSPASSTWSPTSSIAWPRNRVGREISPSTRSVTALREVIACFPVYRSYIADDGVHDADRRYIEAAVRRAIARNPLVEPACVSLHSRHAAPEVSRALGAEDLRRAAAQFAGKFQQVTAPVTAKGVEDTAFYVYNRLVSLNEVGGEPGRLRRPA